MTAPARPVMRYHGGKWRLAPWIIRHFPPHQAYVEPFGGAASVLLRKPRAQHEVYNDLDEAIVNVFRVLRDPVTAEALRRVCELTPFARVEFEACYGAEVEDPVERARRTIAATFMAHGTTARKRNGTGFRAKGIHGLATAAREWAGWPAHLPAFVERLRGVTIERRPALEVIAQQDSPRTLFYLDPPYPIATRTSAVSHAERAYHFNLTDDEHRELAEVLRTVEGHVVISGYACDLYDEELYPDWHRVVRSANTDGGGLREEVLWISPSARRLELFA
ncbi:DNA adenine methylase [Gaopeijia maritima]|uniref:DNA adenine methylase n=1 Tax=Gaopeijia maritima TaxID=3119007 RepID=UPI00328F4B06